MLPGSNQIVACPECGALASYGTLESGNTLGATLWSDGKSIAPMMPIPPSVVRCHSCTKCYWLEDASEIGQVSSWGAEEDVDPAWLAAPDVEEPSEEEYYSAIRAGLADDADTERQLRVFAWWRHNDSYRETDLSEAPAMSDGCVANLEALVGLLVDDDAHTQIMRGEVYRQLGNSHESIKALNLVPMDYAPIVGQIHERAARGDRRLIVLSQDP